MKSSSKEKDKTAQRKTPQFQQQENLPQMAPPPFQLKASEDPVQKKDDPQSVDQQMEQQAGVPVSGQSIDFSVNLGGGQSLYDEGQNTVHTGENGVGVYVSVSTHGFSVRFAPGMTVTHDPGRWLPNVDVNLTGYSWNFANQELNASWNARRIVNWLGDPGTQIHSVMRENVLSKLPSRMFQEGYDPFQDPNLISDFTQLFQSMGSTGDMEMPENSRASLGAGFTLDEDYTTDAGGYDISIPAGTRIRMRANAGGGIPEDFADTSVDSLTLELSGGDANVDISILGEKISAINIRRITFRNGGDVSFEYGLVTETLASLGKLLLMIGQLRTGQDMGVRSIESNHEGIRQIIDEKLDEAVEPMVREMILSNKNLLPGLDLSSVLGLAN